MKKMGIFVSGQSEKPILFEVFTDEKDESDALKMLYSLENSAKANMKNMAKKVLGERGKATIKKILGK